MKKTIAYVLQDDIFFNNLTVREQLYYTAVLRLPECTTPTPATNSNTQNNSFWSRLCSFSGMNSPNYHNKMNEVNAIIKLLRLEKCADTPIALVSGGERKRCNIGTELLTAPKILLLDEPTSGLDSTAANSLILTLRQLAAHGLTIATSIHQPSSKIFYSFDQLFLLADGHVVYNGPPSKCLAYFSSLHYHPPTDYNPVKIIYIYIYSLFLTLIF